jgi:hypothetical protein
MGSSPVNALCSQGRCDCHSPLCILDIDAVHIPASEERRPCMFLEQIDPPDVAAQRVEALVPAHLR